MMARSEPEVAIAEQILAVREFNRFYTARLGLLRRYHLDGDLSLSEARILYEIGAHPLTTASALRCKLELDAGFVSRLLASLTKIKLVRQVTSKTDGRERHLTLSASGERAVAQLNTQSTGQIQEMLANIRAADRQQLITSLSKVREILSRVEIPTVRIERLTAADPSAIAILQEYYEAVQVLQRDTPKSIERIVEESASGMWLAYMGGEVVGCVILRRLSSVPHASECKRLYVRPSVRGNHIADKLLDAQEDFARSQGVRWIYLDSYDDLKEAIALYERRGYRRCKRYNDNPQATLFMRKKIA